MLIYEPNLFTGTRRQFRRGRHVESTVSLADDGLYKQNQEFMGSKKFGNTVHVVSTDGVKSAIPSSV